MLDRVPGTPNLYRLCSELQQQEGVLPAHYAHVPTVSSGFKALTD